MNDRRTDTAGEHQGVLGWLSCRKHIIWTVGSLVAIGCTSLGAWWMVICLRGENETSSAESASAAMAKLPRDSEVIIDKLVGLTSELGEVKGECNALGIEAETIERHRDALRQAIQDLQNERVEETAHLEIAHALDALARGETHATEAILERRAHRKELPNAKRATAYFNLGVLASARDLQVSERAYRKATQLDPLLADAWYQLGGVLERRFDWQGARDVYVGGLNTVFDERDKGIIYCKLGHVTLEQGAPKGAIAYLKSGEHIFHSLNEKRWLAFTHELLGAAYERKQIDSATSHYRTALSLFESVNDTMGVGRILSRLATADEKRGDLDSAIALARKALQLRSERGDKCGEASASLRLGSAYRMKGELQQAEGFTSTALKLYEKLEDDSNVSIALGNLANIYRERGQYEAAFEYYNRSLAMGKSAGNKQSVATQHGNLGIAFEARGERDRALQHHEQALKLYAELGDDWGMAVQYAKLGGVYQRRGQADFAVQSYTNAVRLFEAMGTDAPAQTARLRLWAVTHDSSAQN